MNNRLTIQDLAGLLAEYTGKDKNSTERFLKEFVAVVSEGVCTDKIVKVKGLGTFKIIRVEKRESIHVNTGERFLIPEHYKFSFLPDKELKELVNKPFSFFETTEIGENVDFSDLDISDDADEKDIEDESIEEVMPEEQPIHIYNEEPEEKVETEPDTEPEAETLSPHLMRGRIEADPITKESSIIEADPIIEENQLSCDPASSAGIGRSSSKRGASSKRIYLIIACITLFAIVNVTVYLNRDFFLKSGNEVTRLAIDTPLLPQTPDTLKQERIPDAVAPDTLPQQQTVAVTPEVTTPASSSKVIAKVKIEPGSRLTLIALEYYGSKVFWVYLYEYNKTVIKDPNNVAIGTVIEVPAPEVYGINVRNRASVEKAAARQTEILDGKL